MQDTYLVTFNCDLSPENRRIFKDRIGRLVNEFLPTETAVSVDHMGTPIIDLDQKPKRR